MRTVGHDVLTVHEANLTSRADNAVLDYARQHSRVVLTRNCDDFFKLHQAQPIHSGILAIYQNPDLARNMSYQAIADAVSNLEVTDYSLENEFVVLNQWNY